MKSRITLHTFRKVARQEETMLRAMMPRTSAVDATPFTFAADGPKARVATRTFTLTYTLAEARHG